MRESVWVGEAEERERMGQRREDESGGWAEEEERERERIAMDNVKHCLL